MNAAKNKISELIERIKYTQNKPIWIKAALGIMTTDLKPKLAMEECTIGDKKIKIYGIHGLNRPARQVVDLATLPLSSSRLKASKRGTRWPCSVSGVLQHTFFCQ